jgi:hypothetical protein
MICALTARILYERGKRQSGRSSMVERQFSKLHTRVRFPSPAPRSRIVGPLLLCCSILTAVCRITQISPRRVCCCEKVHWWQPQISPHLRAVNVGGATNGFNLLLTPSSAASYYRVFATMRKGVTSVFYSPKDYPPPSLTGAECCHEHGKIFSGECRLTKT